MKKSNAKNSKTETSKDSWKVTAILIILLVQTMLLSAVLIEVDSLGDTFDRLIAPAREAEPSPLEAAPTRNVDADDDAVKGDPDAPVEIIEFSDFECPFCGKFFAETLPLIQSEYIDTGKVKLVYRDFPLNSHRNAQKAAEAAECAGEQDKFWEYHDVLFERQRELSVDNMKAWAVELELDTDAFNTCLDSGAMREEVLKDFNDGRRAGVTGTPGFLINGKLLTGAQPFEVFQQIIEGELGN